MAVREAGVEAGKGRADTQVCPYEAPVVERAAEHSSDTGAMNRAPTRSVRFAPSLDNVRGYRLRTRSTASYRGTGLPISRPGCTSSTSIS